MIKVQLKNEIFNKLVHLSIVIVALDTPSVHLIISPHFNYIIISLVKIHSYQQPDNIFKLGQFKDLIEICNHQN